MTEYIFYILSIIGISYFITGSDLAEPFRESIKKTNKDLVYPFKWIVNKFEGVITCIYCCSFWIAILVYYLGFIDSEIINFILSGFSVMGFMWVVKNLGK